MPPFKPIELKSNFVLDYNNGEEIVVLTQNTNNSSVTVSITDSNGTVTTKTIPAGRFMQMLKGFINV